MEGGDRLGANPMAVGDPRRIGVSAPLPEHVEALVPRIEVNHLGDPRDRTDPLVLPPTNYPGERRRWLRAKYGLDVMVCGTNIRSCTFPIW